MPVFVVAVFVVIASAKLIRYENLTKKYVAVAAVAVAFYASISDSTVLHTVSHHIRTAVYYVIHSLYVRTVQKYCTYGYILAQYTTYTDIVPLLY